MKYEGVKSFWGGHREKDAIVANAYCLSNDTELKQKWNKFTRSYYRLYNDGDTFHFGRLKSLAKLVGYEFPRFTHYSEAHDIEEIGNRLLDLVLQDRAETVNYD